MAYSAVPTLPACWPLYPSAPSGGSPCGIAEPLQGAAAYYASAPCRGSAMPSCLPAMYVAPHASVTWPWKLCLRYAAPATKATSLPSCLPAMYEVCEPSLNCPRPPISASKEGRRHSLFGRAASPPCWPIYPSAPRGSPCGIAEPLQAASAYYASAPCRGSAMPSWLPAMARQ